MIKYKKIVIELTDNRVVYLSLPKDINYREYVTLKVKIQEALEHFLPVPIEVNKPVISPASKTARLWFKELPVDIGAKALANSYGFMLECNCESLNYALSACFYWEESPEGHTFWANVQRKYCNK